MLSKCLGLLVLVTLLLSARGTATAAAPPWKLDLDAASFSRYFLMDPEGNGLKPAEVNVLPAIRKDHRLAGEGWVEYDFAVPVSGWYELSLTKGETVQDHDFFVDGQVHVYGEFRGKITNLWLEAGPHVLRAQRYTYVRDLAGPWLLFDNLADTHQMDNLVGKPGAAGLQARCDAALRGDGAGRRDLRARRRRRQFPPTTLLS